VPDERKGTGRSPISGVPVTSTAPRMLRAKGGRPDLSKDERLAAWELNQ